jgi:hypothetical protein
MPVIPPLWRRRQEDQELKDSLGYISRPISLFVFLHSLAVLELEHMALIYLAAALPLEPYLLPCETLSPK